MDSGPQSDIEDLRQRALKLVIGFGDAIEEDTDLVKSIKEKLDSDDDLDELLPSMMDYVSSKSHESLLKEVFWSEKKIASYIKAYNIHAELSVIKISDKEKIKDIGRRITELEGILENVKSPSVKNYLSGFLNNARKYTNQAPREVANTTKRLFYSIANRVNGRGRSKKSKSKNTKKSREKRNMVKSLKKRQKHKTKSKKKTKNTI